MRRRAGARAPPGRESLARRAPPKGASTQEASGWASFQSYQVSEEVVDVPVRVPVQQLVVGGERVAHFHLERRRPSPRMVLARGVAQRNIEVVDADQYARDRWTGRRGDGDAGRVPLDLTAPPTSSHSAARKQEALLQVERLVLASDAGEFRGRRVARVARA